MSQMRSQGGAAYAVQTPTSAASPNSATVSAKIGDRAFERIEKTSAEFFAITYGALVRQMYLDHNENADVVNTQLDLMGERIGVRLIEEYAARSGAPPCRSPAQAAESLAKIGLRMFLGIQANVEMVTGGGATAASPAAPSVDAAVSAAGGSRSGGGGAASVLTFAVTFDENPLNTFVELPDTLRAQLWYSNVLCGVIRGALGQVGHYTQVSYVRDVLRGDETNEIRLTFQGKEKETFKVDMQK